MKLWLLLLALGTLPLSAQSNTGELRLSVTDPTGLSVKSSVQIVSQANHYQQFLQTDDDGNLGLKRLPFGLYLLQVRRDGFAAFSTPVEIHRTARIRV